MIYEISLDGCVWSTTDSDIAATWAPKIARLYGGCEMTMKNDTGGGHVTVYDAAGNIKEMRGLECSNLDA